MWRFDSDVNTGTWKTVESPVSVTLQDVTDTAFGACAVGNSGYVLGRTPEGKWGVAVDDGPNAESQSLHCVDVTNDGERVWFAGSGGALGYYDLRNHERRSHSHPKGLDTTFHAIIVEGNRDSEKVMVADGSGNVIPGDMNNGSMEWDTASRPANGNSVYALAANEKGFGYAVDANSNVRKTTTDEGWETIGISQAGSSFYAAIGNKQKLLVGGGNGRLYITEDEESWTPYDLGNFTIESIDIAGDEMLAAGGSGSIRYRKGSSDWVEVGWEGSKGLNGVALSDTGIAVGKSGTIVEQHMENSS